eukprot:14589928-Alexandrium_andersonii.AAC.1
MEPLYAPVTQHFHHCLALHLAGPLPWDAAAWAWGAKACVRNSQRHSSLDPDIPLGQGAAPRNAPPSSARGARACAFG